MSGRAFPSFLLTFLVFSYVVFAVAAVPTTRTLNLNHQDTSSVASSADQVVPVLDMYVGDEMLIDVDGAEEESFMKGRMDLETSDYGGTGANKDHEPKTPGRA